MKNVMIWSLFLKYVIGIFTMKHETSVSNIHFLDGRLEFFENFKTWEQCTAECFSDTQCVSVAYSTLTGSCQLYMYDASNFTVDVIVQKHTDFYKVVCTRHDYTFIRALSLCMKMCTDELAFTEASNACVADGANLLQIDTAEKMAYLKPVLAHISDDYGYYLGGYGVDGTALYKWYGLDDSLGTNIDVSNGGAFWGSNGVPLCMNPKGCCLSLQAINGSTPLFASEDCTKQLMFICTMDMF